MMSWSEIIVTLEDAIENEKIDSFDEFNPNDFEEIFEKEEGGKEVLESFRKFYKEKEALKKFCESFYSAFG